MEYVWEKPVVVFYKERHEKLEREAFAVIKAKRLTVSRVEEKDAKFRGSIEDFFPLMGDIDYVSSEEGMSDRYVLCWFEDEEDDINEAWRRLTGVRFPDGAAFTTEKRMKRIYNASFRAEQGKLK